MLLLIEFEFLVIAGIARIIPSARVGDLSESAESPFDESAGDELKELEALDKRPVKSAGESERPKLSYKFVMMISICNLAT